MSQLSQLKTALDNAITELAKYDLEWAKQLKNRLLEIDQAAYKATAEITTAQAAYNLCSTIRRCFLLTEIAGYSIPEKARNDSELTWVDGGVRLTAANKPLIIKLRIAYGVKRPLTEQFAIDVQLLIDTYKDAEDPAWAAAIAKELSAIEAVSSALGFVQARTALLAIKNQADCAALRYFKCLETHLIRGSKQVGFIAPAEIELANRVLFFAVRAVNAMKTYTVTAIAVNEEGGNTHISLRSKAEPVRELTFSHTEAARFAQVQAFLAAAGAAADGYAVTAVAEHEGGTRLTLRSTAAPVREFSFLHTEAARFAQVQAFLAAAGATANSYAVTAIEAHGDNTCLTLHCAAADTDFKLLHTQSAFLPLMPALLRLREITSNYVPTAGGDGHTQTARLMTRLLPILNATSPNLMALNLKTAFEAEFGTYAVHETAATAASTLTFGLTSYLVTGSNFYKDVKNILYVEPIKAMHAGAPAWLQTAYTTAEALAHIQEGRYPTHIEDVAAGDGSTHHQIMFKDVSGTEAEVHSVRFDSDGSAMTVTAAAAAL